MKSARIMKWDILPFYYLKIIIQNRGAYCFHIIRLLLFVFCYFLLFPLPPVLVSDGGTGFVIGGSLYTFLIDTSYNILSIIIKNVDNTTIPNDIKYTIIEAIIRFARLSFIKWRLFHTSSIVSVKLLFRCSGERKYCSFAKIWFIISTGAESERYLYLHDTHNASIMLATNSNRQIMVMVFKKAAEMMLVLFTFSYTTNKIPVVMEKAVIILLD